MMMMTTTTTPTTTTTTSTKTTTIMMMMMLIGVDLDFGFTCVSRREEGKGGRHTGQTRQKGTN